MKAKTTNNSCLVTILLLLGSFCPLFSNEPESSIPAKEEAIDNLFDKEKNEIISGEMVQYNNGKIYSNTQYNHVVLHCNPGSEYAINTGYCHMAFFDGSPNLTNQSNYIGGVTSYKKKDPIYSWITPPKATYMTLSFPATATDKIILNELSFIHEIKFDTSNIKQFWINDCVLANKDSIEIMLKNDSHEVLKSEPLKIQLVQVNKNQYCRVEVFSNNPQVNYSVVDDSNTSKILSTSSLQENDKTKQSFISLFSLRDTKDFSFSLIFSSDKDASITIEKIVLHITGSN